MTTDERYPIGRFVRPAQFTNESRAFATAEIAEAAPRLRAAVAGLSEAQLDQPYREGGWTVRQLVHHVADSHMNAYVRTRLALTEENPTIKPYEEQLWAELSDAKTFPVEVSLKMIDAMHARWAGLLELLSAEQWSRPLTHPVNGAMTIESMIAMYAWHSNHHIAHVTELRRAQDW